MSILKNKVRSFLKKLTSSFSEDEKVLIRRCIKFSASVFVTSLILFYLPEVRKVINEGVSEFVGILMLITDFSILFPPLTIIPALLYIPSYFLLGFEELTFTLFNLILNNIFLFGCLVLACSTKRIKLQTILLTIFISVPVYLYLANDMSRNKIKIENIYYDFAMYTNLISIFIVYLMTLLISYFLRKKKNSNIINLSKKSKVSISLLLLCVYFISATHNSYFIGFSDVEVLKFNKVVKLPERIKVKNVKIEVEDLNPNELSKDLIKKINAYETKSIGKSFLYEDKENIIKKIFLYKKDDYKTGYSSTYITNNKLLITDNNTIVIIDISYRDPKIIYKYKLPDNYYKYFSDYRNRVIYENDILYLQRRKKENNNSIDYVIKIDLKNKSFDEFEVNSPVHFLSNKYIFIYSRERNNDCSRDFCFKFFDIYKAENFEYIHSINPIFIKDKFKYDFDPSLHLFDEKIYLHEGFVYRLDGIRHKMKINLTEALRVGKIENE